MPAGRRVVLEPPTDFPSVPSEGYWEWREDVGGGLRFVSLEKKKKNVRGSAAAAGGYASQLENMLQSLQKQKTAATIQKEDTVLTDQRISLAHVKEVALEISEIKETSTKAALRDFHTLISSRGFDNFVMSLFLYFDNYFKIQEIDNQPRGMVAEMSAVEKKARADAMQSLTSAEKALGFNYSILILGLELPEQHHMSAGTEGQKKDRIQYGKLYSYCSYLVFVCFKRPDMELVRREVGRILKSNHFNPSARPASADHVSFTQRAKSNDNTYLKVGVANTKVRKDLVKRPPIMSIVNQKSPAIISLLPSTKEQSAWLFTKLDDGTVKRMARSRDDSEMSDLNKIFAGGQHKVGIIGESILKFNPKTLLPLEAEKKSAAELEKENAEDTDEIHLTDSPQVPEITQEALNE